MDQLDLLVTESKNKGGAQHCDEQSLVNINLKWLGLFHREKHMPGYFMWRLRCPNGYFSIKQWNVPDLSIDKQPLRHNPKDLYPYKYHKLP